MKREEIKEALERAKKNYCELKYGYGGLCLYIHDALKCSETYKDPKDVIYICDAIKSVIPEFNPEFFSANPTPGFSLQPKTWYWWTKEDTKSRMAALDKLIKLYSKD